MKVIIELALENKFTSIMLSGVISGIVFIMHKYLNLDVQTI